MGTQEGGFDMFAWFQRLLPKSGDFYALFERHAATLVAAAEALDAMTQGKAETHTAIRTIVDREHDADDVIRETLHAVRQTFLTPFDRGAITSLIGAMDDVIDEMQSAGSAVEPASSSRPAGSSPRSCRCCATSNATARACTN